MNVLRQYIENGMQITEYTKDGVTVSHRVETPIINTPTPPQPTLEEQIAELKQDNLILMDALATTFEEILNIQLQIGGV